MSNSQILDALGFFKKFSAKLACNDTKTAVVVARPLPKDGGIAEFVMRQRATKGQAAQRVHSRTVQNEMKSVQGQMSPGAAGRIFDSANSEQLKA